MTRYLLFSAPTIPPNMVVHCPQCNEDVTAESDAPVPICGKCNSTMRVKEPLIQSGLYCWCQAFRENGGVGEMFATIEKEYLERYDIVHINYTPGHPSYIEAIRNALGPNSDTKIVANVDYAMSLWETMNPYNLKSQLGMADMVFHVEETGARLLQHFLGKPVHTIPHPVDTARIKQHQGRPPTNGVLATCQWHRYNATWSAYYYGLHNINIKRYLVAFGGANPSALVDLEAMFHRVVPVMRYVPYLDTILSKATINLDLAPDVTYGRGYVEAAALGVPTVASNTIAAARRVAPELTVKPYDHIEIERLTHKLTGNPEFYHAMVKQGRERSEFYSCANSYDRLMEALDGVN